jgi:hypothetical protein
MKISSLTALLTCLSFISFSQADKKLKKLIGKHFVELAPTDNYSWKPEGEIIFYDSKTTKGDTTGASNKGEFLMFRDDIISQSGEAFKMFRPGFVTNYEYEKFVIWVRDSTMLEHVYLNTDPTGNDAIDEYDLAYMLDFDDMYYSEVNQAWQEFDPSQPFINRELFNLSWRMKGIKDNQIIPLISDMYLRPDERFYDFKDWDERKFFYGKYGSGKEVPIAPDRDVWAQKSEYPYDLYYNLANYYSREDESNGYPVIGLTGTQIEAFLDHEEIKLQKKLNEAEFPYTVHLSLPTEEEIKLGDTSDCDCKMTFLLESMDMTEQWQITNEEYWEFLLSVQDSILRENIYYNTDPTGKNAIEDEDIGEMLNHGDVYYDEVNLSWQEFDPSQPYINRGLFPMSQSFNWKKTITPAQYVPIFENFFQHPEKMDTIKGNVDHKDFKFEEYTYKYYWEDLGRRSKTGELVWNTSKERYDAKDVWNGKGVDLDQKSLPGFESGIRTHANLRDFILEEYVSVYPGINCTACNWNCMHEHGEELNFEEQQEVCDKCPLDWNENAKPYDFWTQPEELIQDLTYYQAMAYYNWKYHRNTRSSKSETRYHDDLVPTKEQFEKVQKGESFVLDEQKLEFPDPWFRYVIHFYPKK